MQIPDGEFLCPRCKADNNPATFLKTASHKNTPATLKSDLIKHAAGAVVAANPKSNGRPASSLFPSERALGGVGGLGAGGGGGKGTMAFAATASVGGGMRGAPGVGQGQEQDAGAVGGEVAATAAEGEEGELLAPDGSVVNRTHIAM